MSKPPIPSPVAQTISGAFMVEDRGSWLKRRRGVIAIALGGAIGALALVLVLNTRAERAAEVESYRPPQLSAAEAKSADMQRTSKATSDARAADQARRDSASAEAAPEAYRQQEGVREAPDDMGDRR